MKSVNNSSYNQDDGFVIRDFFAKPKPKKEKGFVPDIPDISSNDVKIFHVETYVLYNISGYIYYPELQNTMSIVQFVCIQQVQRPNVYVQNTQNTWKRGVTNMKHYFCLTKKHLSFSNKWRSISDDTFRISKLITA